jgi:flagellar biosynthesis anti-sigma factor FlgM
MDKMWLEKARQIVDQTPEIRPEKVAAIQQALEEGRYEIDARKLANILLAEWLLER